MSLVESLMQAALTAPDEHKAAALRVLRGEVAVEDHDQKPAVGTTEPFVTLRECARRLGVSTCSLWRWQIPGHSLGGRRRFRVSEVVAYLESDAVKQRAAELRQERKEVVEDRLQTED